MSEQSENPEDLEGIDVEIDDSDEMPSSMIENDDGSVDIVDDESENDENSEFLENLAEKLDQTELKKLARELCELVEIDKEARKRRDDQYEEGLRRTGLGNDAPGGANFHGASKAVHPMLAECCIDFASRAIKEIFPSTGPVKTAIYGNEGGDRVTLANKKAKFLNWQLTESIEEYRDELEQLLTQVPMGGSQYQKFWWDEDLGRPRSEFVPIDHIFLPFSAKNFYTAGRVTQELFLTEAEFEERIEKGLYREIDNLLAPGSTPEVSASESANMKIEGKEDASAYNEDGLRNCYEIYTWRSFDDDRYTKGRHSPYIITVDVHTEEIVGVYRNWEEEDKKFQKLDWFVEWKFIPWRGAYAIGFPHLIGSLSGAATGSLRALLDSAHINNAATLVKLKGGKTSGQNIEVEPTQIADIEGPAGADDIRKVIMPMPYNAPSPVLFQLLGWLTQAGKGVIATAEEKMENIGDRTPVGTTQAMIEQGSQTYSAIHARLHHSQARALKIVCRLNATYLDDEVTVQELGELVMSREDFRTTRDISPVSDPHIFSESQRYAQMQGTSQLTQLFPDLEWNRNAIARRFLDRMRVPDYDELLPATPKPQNMNPAAENVAAMHGQPILALPKQNHLAHIYMHVEFALNPIFANPILGSKLMATMTRHIGEHIGFYYADLMAMETRYEDQVLQTPTQQLEDSMARANIRVLQRMTADLQGIMPKLQQIQQLASQFAPPPPMDPAVKATYDAAMAKINADKEVATQKLQLEREVETQIKPNLEKTKGIVDLQKNVQDNRQKHVTELLKNQGDNQTKQWIAVMQAGNANEMQVYQSKLDQQEAEANRMHQTDLAKLSASAGTGGQVALPAPEGEAQPVGDPEVDQQQFEALMQANQQTQQMTQGLLQAIQQLTQLVVAPKQVVRDPSGNLIGVQTVGVKQNGNVQ